MQKNLAISTPIEGKYNMKKFILLAFMCAGCATTAVPVESKPEAPCPTREAPPAPSCSDELHLLNETDLGKVFTCPSNTKVTFPSFYQAGKVLVLCQCK